MATETTVPQEDVIQAESAVPHDDVDVEASPQPEEVEPEARDKPDGKKESTAPREREQGKSILPFSRVQKIIKVDKVRPPSRHMSS